MPKGYLHQFNHEPLELDFPDDPIAAANLAVRMIDEWNGNILSYPSVMSETEHLEEEGEEE